MKSIFIYLLVMLMTFLLTMALNLKGKTNGQDDYVNEAGRQKPQNTTFILVTH
jgi:hypothetical protein